MPDFEVSEHHMIFADAIEKFISREYKNLIISCPPRHGKSEMVSRRLPAYLFGLNPDINIIAASYSADLSSRMNRDVQRIIDDYRYADLFPETYLTSKNVRNNLKSNFVRNSDMFEIVDNKGIYRSTGVGGGITGMGAYFGIIDDPIKDHEEANSPRIRQKIWDWYTSTFLTRIESDGGVLICQTRWNTDDLIGRVENHKDFHVINLPAISDEGKALWPSRYDIDFLKQRKKDLGSKMFESLYQQSPILDGGNIIKSDWIKHWIILPQRFDDMVMSWDMTFAGSVHSDYVVGQVWGRYGADFYLLDQIRGQLDFTETVAKVELLSLKYLNCSKILVENKANGPAVMNHLKQKIPGMIPVNPKSDKVSRLHAVSPLFEAGNVFFPPIESNPWCSSAISETISFPNGKHDDQVDAMTQALSNLKRKDSSGFALSNASLF